MSKPIKEQIFKVGEIVTGRADLGIPASIRNFEPLADIEAEQAEYKKLEDEFINSDEKDDKLGKFYMKMVFPPGEGGRRYRIIKGAEYRILVEGSYEELFNKAKSKNDSDPKD